MYSMDDLFHLVNSDGADELRLQVGAPPVLVLRREPNTIEGPPISAENAENLLQSITNTRQRRELRTHGVVQFIYRFRGRTDFVIYARIEDGNVRIVVH
jgi:Tfp pilus assembly ATPase PilU